MVWCGLRNGRVRTRSFSGPSPAAEAIAEAIRASASVSGGRSPGIVRARRVLPEPGGPARTMPCPPARAISRARRPTSWPRTSARSGPGSSAGGPAPASDGGSDVDPRVRGPGRSVGGQLDPARCADPAVPPSSGRTDRVDRLGQARRRARIGTGDESGLREGLVRDDDPTGPASDQCGDHRQDPGHGPDLAPERQLPDERPAPVGPDLLGSEEDPDRDRQVQPGPRLAQVCRGEVHRDPAGWEGEPAVADRSTHPLPGLLERGVREADDGEPGQTRGHVDLDPDDPALDPVERRGEDGRKHAGDGRPPGSPAD